MKNLNANFKFKDSEPETSKLPELSLAERTMILSQFFVSLEKKTVVGTKLSYVKCALCGDPILEENRIPHYVNEHYGKPTDDVNAP